MDIDGDVAVWLLDFLLRHPLENRTLDALLRVLPIPTDDLNLKKLLSLLKLDSDVSEDYISESTLEMLEQLEEVELRCGNEVSVVMKRAYCMAAVECTLSPMKNGEGGDEKIRFDLFQMVKKVWMGRTSRMKVDSGKSGLGSDLLWSWKDDIEAAMWDDDACKRLLQRYEGVRAIEAVRDYLQRFG